VNPLRRVLLGPGRFPGEFRAAFQHEGLVFLQEGLVGSVTYVNYRGPDHRNGSGNLATLGAIAVTRRRLVVWTGRSKHVDIPHGHPLRSVVEVSSDGSDHVRIDYDAGAFHPSRSGHVTLRLRTENAASIVRAVAAAR
jgi:hypothetical protein